MERMIIRPIHTAEQHQNAIQAIADLMALDMPDENEVAMVETLAALVERYEQKTFPLERPTALQAIQFRMDQMGLNQTGLAEMTGLPKSRISEILNGKRELTLEMIRAFHEKLGIPSDILIGRGDIAA